MPLAGTFGGINLCGEMVILSNAMGMRYHRMHQIISRLLRITNRQPHISALLLLPFADPLLVKYTISMINLTREESITLHDRVAEAYINSGCLERLFEMLRVDPDTLTDIEYISYVLPNNRELIRRYVRNDITTETLKTIRAAHKKVNTD